MIAIIIGRNHQTNQLQLSVNGKSQPFGPKNSVPTSVSKEHASFSIMDDGKLVINNLSIQNDTYVNMVGIESKRIKEGDRIELGPDHYVLDWGFLTPFIPKYADIRPLKKVWDDYQRELLDLQIKEKRFGVLRSATGLITTLAIILSMFTGRDNPMFIILYAAAGLISAAFFIKAYMECSKTPMKMQEIKDAFPNKYVCPNCGHFLGQVSYDVLCQNSKCQHCKAIYKK